MQKIKVTTTKQPLSKRLAKQIGSFGLVGVLNTAIDFALFNAGRYLLHLMPVPANLISTTIAQAISFRLNKQFVFAGVTSKHSRTTVVVRFIVITATGLYVVQSLVLAFFAHYFTWPGDTVYALLQSMHINVMRDFAINNVAKLIATVFSAAWNFVLYKKFVFTEATPTTRSKRLKYAKSRQ